MRATEPRKQGGNRMDAAAGRAAKDTDAMVLNELPEEQVHPGQPEIRKPRNGKKGANFR